MYDEGTLPNFETGSPGVVAKSANLSSQDDELVETTLNTIGKEIYGKIRLATNRENMINFIINYTNYSTVYQSNIEELNTLDLVCLKNIVWEMVQLKINQLRIFLNDLEAQTESSSMVLFSPLG